MGHEERKRVWVDHFQTRLMWRIIGYLGLFLVVLVNFLFAWKLMLEGVHDPLGQWLEMFRDYLPVAVCLLLLVPAMAWDAIRFSHRLLGPMVRFRRTMQSIARGELVPPIKLRQGDHLTELRDDFNIMLDALQRRGVPILKPTVTAEEDQSRKPA
jgi:methyl-accepting chemotaxis protein